MLQEEVSKIVNNTDLQVSDVIDDELSGQAPRIPVILECFPISPHFHSLRNILIKLKKLLADDVR
ncbi:hypothetical protein KHA80_11860 [Anaerobacillus sp. HL2]|nr:hypothetical protein KHA80_11860 [Anaerobacillus sp. HL2]